MDIKSINTYEPNFKSLKIVRKRGAKFVHNLNMEELKVFKKCAEMLKDTKHVDVYVGTNANTDSVLISVKNRLRAYQLYCSELCGDGHLHLSLRRYEKNDVNDWWKPKEELARDYFEIITTESERKELKLNKNLETEELARVSMAALELDKKIDKEIAEFKEKVGDSPKRTELIKSLLKKYSGDEKIDPDKDYSFVDL